MTVLGRPFNDSLRPATGPFPKLLLDDFKCRRYFLQNFFKLGFQKRLLGLITTSTDRNPAIRSNCFAQAALHAIAIHGAAQYFPDRKTRRAAPVLPPAASKKRSCDGKNAGVLVCKRARNPHGVAAVRCVGNFCVTVGHHLRSERLRSQHSSPSSVCGNFRDCRKGKFTRGSQVSPRRACVPWRAGAKALRAALGLHPRSKSVLLRTVTPVRLECALGHEKSLLLVSSMAYGQTKSINEPEQGGKRQARGRQVGVSDVCSKLATYQAQFRPGEFQLTFSGR